MSITESQPNATVTAPLAGLALVAKIRGLLIVSVIAGLVSPMFMAATTSYCPGGIDGSGGFIDAAGQSVDEAPRCIDMALKPSPLLYVAIGLIVLIAINRVMKAADEASALRTLGRASMTVGVLVVVAIMISQVWFQTIPIEQFSTGSWSVLSPFPFGLIDVTDSPMSTP